MLCAFPDRVAKRRSGDEYLLASGGSALLPGGRHEWIVAADVEQRRERSLPLIRLASPIEPEWLLDLFPDRVQEHATVQWNRSAERVDSYSALLYDELVITESRSGEVDQVQAAEVLSRQALEAGVERFTNREQWDQLLARCEFAARFATIRAPDPAQAVELACTGLRSFAELRKVDWPAQLLASLSSAERRLLAEIAPERVQLPSGRPARIHYARDQTPWVASRIQDFFGLQNTPSVARGQVPLVVHLLAPSQRPVQVTSDLAGFWKNHYPAVRRELSRRYPKHAWPEQPGR